MPGVVYVFTGGPDRKKFLAKRIGQLHMSYLEMHKIYAQSELEENKVRSWSKAKSHYLDCSFNTSA